MSPVVHTPFLHLTCPCRSPPCTSFDNACNRTVLHFTYHDHLWCDVLAGVTDVTAFSHCPGDCIFTADRPPLDPLDPFICPHTTDYVPGTCPLSPCRCCLSHHLRYLLLVGQGMFSLNLPYECPTVDCARGRQPQLGAPVLLIRSQRARLHWSRCM